MNILSSNSLQGWGPGDLASLAIAAGMIAARLVAAQVAATIGLAVIAAIWAPAAEAITVQDDAGNSVSLRTYPHRIVSLAPGATEMLFAAGAGQSVIATVQYSDEPPAAKQVPRIGDVVAIDMEKLLALSPEVAIVWPGGGNPAQIEEIGRLGIPLYRQQVNSLADLPGSLHRLGQLTGTSAVADRAARDIEERLHNLADKYRTERHPTVLLQVWNHPVYTIGGTHIISDALRVCGARNVFGDLRELGPVVDVEAIVARNPDIIVAAAPPGAGRAWVAEWQRFTSLRAVRNHNVIIFEDQRLTRLGPSVVDATAELCKALATARLP